MEGARRRGGGDGAGADRAQLRDRIASHDGGPAGVDRALAQRPVARGSARVRAGAGSGAGDVRIFAGGSRLMVIGVGFAWAHLPKTGGDATLAMFRLFPDLIEFADPDDTNDKHAFFHSRAAEIRGKVLAMNIRRLPAWVLSRAQHVSRRGLYPDYEPQPMGTPDELADSSFPDERLLLYTSEGRFQPDRW